MNLKILRLYLILTMLSIFILNSCSVQKKVEKEAKKNVKILASDGFHGRGYTHNGLQKSEDFLIEKFTEIGLEPVFDDYKQTVKIPINILHSSELKINDKTYKFGVDYLVGANAESDELEAETFNIPKILMDFSNEDKREIFRIIAQNYGKIPVIDFRGAKADYKENMLGFSSYLDKEKNLYDFPAIVHLEDKLTHGLSPIQDNFIHIYLKENIEEETVINLNVNAEKDTAYLSHNIVGKIAGTQGDSAIFVTAHFDHLGQVNQTIFSGANDNASGVSMLLALAKYFKNNPPKNDIYFYALTGEEVGLKGAEVAVENLPIAKEKIKFLVNLDILGTGDEGIQVVNSTIFEKEFALLNSINQQQQLLSQIKPRGEACNSDHCIFYQEGIPCFFIYTLGGVSHYHDPLDKAKTLPLTEFYDLFILLQLFIEKL